MDLDLFSFVFGSLIGSIITVLVICVIFYIKELEDK